MKTLQQFITESTGAAWQHPSADSVKHEYNIEYLNHHTDTGFYKNEKEFTDAVKKAKVLKVTPDVDSHVSGRSNTRTFGQLLSLIKGYASYPKYRNEKTLKALSDRIASGKAVDYPLLLKTGENRYRVMGGNTRADLAMQHHGHYHALVLEKPAR